MARVPGSSRDGRCRPVSSKCSNASPTVCSTPAQTPCQSEIRECLLISHDAVRRYSGRARAHGAANRARRRKLPRVCSPARRAGPASLPSCISIARTPASASSWVRGFEWVIWRSESAYLTWILGGLRAAVQRRSSRAFGGRVNDLGLADPPARSDRRRVVRALSAPEELRSKLEDSRPFGRWAAKPVDGAGRGRSSKTVAHPRPRSYGRPYGLTRLRFEHCVFAGLDPYRQAGVYSSRPRDPAADTAPRTAHSGIC
jgi:hypothetical protein